MEIWCPCYGYEKYAEVSNKGRIRSLDRYIKNGTKKLFKKSIIYSQSNDKDGYKIITFSFDGIQSTERVHRLILLSFDYNDNHGTLTVNHLDGVKDNNYLENIEWATYKENMAHAIENKLVEHKEKTLYNLICKECNQEFISNRNKSKYCSHKCFYKSRRIVNRPSKKQLIEDITSMPMSLVGDKYKVSCNSVRKWCKFYEIPFKLKDIKKLKEDIGV